MFNSHGVTRSVRRRRAWRAFLGLLVVGTGAVGRAGPPPAEPVSIYAEDGVRLAAAYTRPVEKRSGPAPLVMLLHGQGQDCSAWEPLVPMLHDAGFAVLALNLRGHGDSATTETRELARNLDPALFRAMQSDLLGAYNWLAKQPEIDRARLALVGVDVGASVVFQYAAKDRSIDVVVGISPGLNLAGLDAAGDVHQISGRQVLLITNEAGRDAAYTLKARTTGVTVDLIPRRQETGLELVSVVPGLDRKIADFLAKQVGTPSRDVVVGSIESNIYHQPNSGWVERISPSNLRYYSSPAEAEGRGVRASKSSGPRGGGKKP